MQAAPLVFVTTPFSDDFLDVRPTVRQTFERAGWRVAAPKEMTPTSASFVSLVYVMIEQVDSVIADRPNNNLNTIYQLGIAHGLRK